MRLHLRRILTVVTSLSVFVIAVIAIIASKPLEWRAELLLLKFNGRLPEIPTLQLIEWLLPGSAVYLGDLTRHRNPDIAVRNINVGRESVINESAINMGGDIYAARCHSCHEIQDSKAAAQDLLNFVGNSTDWQFLATIKWHHDHSAFVSDQLDDREIWALLSYLRSRVVALADSQSDFDVASASGYTTQFELNENPISEGGRWTQHGGITGLDWTNVQTLNGLAFGTQTGLHGYDDSVALLAGFDADQRVTATIHFSGQRSAATRTHEVEIILRGNYTPHQQHHYECNVGYRGHDGWYMQIMRMDGRQGRFTQIDIPISPVPSIHDGDIFTAEVIGSEISSYINGVKILRASDSRYSMGQPGIAFFWRGTENISDFAFQKVAAANR